MNAERLLSLYDRIADAPDAVARLRRFILDLAVRGKLVPQDPADEPAAELLKRIAKEKARLRGKTTGSVLQPNEIPFDLPRGWAWSRIGEVTSKTGSGSTPRGGKEVYKDAGVPFLRSQNIYDDGLRLSDVAYIEGDTHERMNGTKVLPGDLLLNITGGSMGRCCLVPASLGEANISQHVAIIRLAYRGMGNFLHRLVLSPYFQAFVFDEQTGAGRGGLPKNRMDNIAVPLPPLAEQHRIVAKVDELMALCDRLEAARGTREAARDRLAASSLARLRTPDAAPANFADHARFALENLAALATRPDQIKPLRQTILDLAVRGKLVPQDPNDEPATELFKRISRQRAALVRDRRIRGDSVPSTPEGNPDDLEPPKGWANCALGQISIVTDPNPSHRYPDYTGGSVPILSTQEFSGLDDWDPASAKLTTSDFWQFQRDHCDFGEGDIVFARKGRLGLPRLLPRIDRFTFSHTVFIIKPMRGVSSTFLLWLLRRDATIEWLTNEMNQNTGVPTLGKAKTERLPIGLPPLAEQHRIVAKVDALMALCDRLEASLTAAADTRRRLLDALIAEALAPSPLAAE